MSNLTLAADEQILVLKRIAELSDLPLAVSWINEKLGVPTRVAPVASGSLCGVRDPKGRICVRLLGHSEQRHRFAPLSKEQAQYRAGQISQTALAAARSNEKDVYQVWIGNHAVKAGDPCGFVASINPNESRGWKGVITRLYEKDGVQYAEILGAKGSTQAQRKSRVIKADRLVYIRPGTFNSSVAKERAGRY